MTDTLIALISILIGIIAANLAGKFFKNYSHGLVGNSIVGAFGSIFLIKSFGRLGFDPRSIMELGSVNYTLFSINSFVSFLGGALGVFFIYKLRTSMVR